MPSFQNEGVRLDYLDEGEGPAVLLVHGFASNRAVNWVNTGWVSLLTRSGRRVLAIDNRGHGRSQKLYEPRDYGTTLMAGDAIALIDHLGLGRAALPPLMDWVFMALSVYFLALSGWRSWALRGGDEK